MPDANTPPDLSMDEILATIRRLITTGERAAAAPRRDPAPASAGEADAVLELTDAIDDSGELRRLAPAVAPAERHSILATPSAERPGAAVRREPRLDTLPALDARTLDGVVRELLQPMLRSWLDTNLPALVERLVRAELARAGREPGLR